ncbi:hypothetical protein ACIBKX_40325 [Streptomyces sp. NPDC050658]
MDDCNNCQGSNCPTCNDPNGLACGGCGQCVFCRQLNPPHTGWDNGAS